jgi:hypothetical protein
VLMVAGGSIGLLSAVSVALIPTSWSDTEVPVVYADPRPFKVKPDNPGGMQVVGSDQQADDTTATLASAAEKPAPDVLQALPIRAGANIEAQ